MRVRAEGTQLLVNPKRPRVCGFLVFFCVFLIALFGFLAGMFFFCLWASIYACCCLRVICFPVVYVCRLCQVVQSRNGTGTWILCSPVVSKATKIKQFTLPLCLYMSHLDRDGDDNDDDPTRILQQLTGCSASQAVQLLADADGDLAKVADDHLCFDRLDAWSYSLLGCGTAHTQRRQRRGAAGKSQAADGEAAAAAAGVESSGIEWN